MKSSILLLSATLLFFLCFTSSEKVLVNNDCANNSKSLSLVSPEDDGYYLDASIKVTRFLWMETRYYDKQLQITNQNISTGFTLLFDLEGIVVPSFNGNITTKHQEFSHIRISERNAITLSYDDPWRKILMYMELRSENNVHHYLNCDLDYRLHSNTSYNMIVMGQFQDPLTRLFIFINGKLIRKCSHKAEKKRFHSEFMNIDSNKIHYTLENKPGAVVIHKRVMYWPRSLTYNEIQQLSFPSSSLSLNLLSSSKKQQINDLNSNEAKVCIDSSESRSTVNTWYSQAIDRYPETNVIDKENVNVCIDENIVIIFYPGFYFEKNASVYSVLWLQQHIQQTLQQALDSVEVCNGSKNVTFLIPLTSDHRQHIENDSFLLKLNIPRGIDILLFTIPKEIKVLGQKIDKLSASYGFASVANVVLQEISLKFNNVEMVTMLSSFIFPEKKWLTKLSTIVLKEKSADIVGGKLVHMSGTLIHYGYELLELSYNGGIDVMLTPHHMYRGYWATDVRTHGQSEALAVSREMMAFSTSRLLGEQLQSENGYFFDEIVSPVFDDVDLCLRAREKKLKVVIAGEVVGISVKGLYMDDTSEVTALTSFIFNPLQMKLSTLNAFQIFSQRWKLKHQKERESNFITPAKLTWIIHCGGSQGLEAATILQTLYKFLDVRTLIRRYSFCEHSDTLSGMPAFFKDILDYTAYRSFTQPYQGFSKLSKALSRQEQERLKLNQTIESLEESVTDVTNKNQLNRSNVLGVLDNKKKSFSKKFHKNEMEMYEDYVEDGSIILYARDYREMGRWLPHDTSYVIGRYMYETDSLPRPWANHCNQLDEVWVPSKWQLEAFATGGVKVEKMFIMGETVDEYFFDPYAMPPLALPGTRLDGFIPPDITKPESSYENLSSNETKRPFAFCAVFKMEDRKGYKELVEGFMSEFENNSDVVLVLRTYIHSGHGITDENFSPYLIRQEIDKHLTWRKLPLSRSNNPNKTRIEIVSEHLPSQQLVSLYSSCDAFVLSTHAEGWGLPTHEAMIMGLPVITTDFGGSTEFVTKDSGLLINVSSLTPTTGDDWLKGGNWAAINITSLREQMSLLYLNRSFAKALGVKGKEYVRKFSPHSVALSYANRIAEIYENIIPTLKKDKINENTLIRGQHSLSPSTSHGDFIASNLDIQFSQSGRFKTCSVRTYKRNRSRKYPSKIVPFGDSYSSTNENSTVTPICDFVIISTWAPRMCGIATFSKELRKSLLAACPAGSRVDVVVVKHKDQPSHEYNGDEVKKVFGEYDAMTYVSAAQFINKNKYHTTLIQYEFGMIYGDHLTCLLRELKSPRVFTTIHTVKINYQDNLHAWVHQANLMSDRLIVMTHSMRHILNSFQAIPTRDVVVIPHGGPNLPYERFEGTERQSFFPGKRVILSNGLIHPMKGLELMIRAMKQVLEVIPDAVYYIHGTPHPTGVGCREYYASIQEEANRTAPNNIFFNDSFASTNDLHVMLRSASVYVNAYTDREQSVSGTLAMALGLGTVAVSTPYAYAAEVLKNNSGRLVPFQDVDALAEAVIDILSDENNRKVMSRSAFAKAQEQIWDNVAQAYIQLANN